MVKKCEKRYSYLLFSLVGFVVFFLYGFRVGDPSAEVSNANKIIEAIGKNKYDSSLERNPGYIYYLSELESNGYKVLKDIPSEKLDAIQMLFEVPMVIDGKLVPADEIVQAINTGQFNVLKYGFELKKDARVTYALGHSGVIVQFLSINEITALVNNRKG